MKHAAKLRIIFCSDNSKSKNTQRYIAFNLCRVSFYVQKIRLPSQAGGNRINSFTIIIRTKTIQYWILNHLYVCKGKHYFLFYKMYDALKLKKIHLSSQTGGENGISK